MAKDWTKIQKKYKGQWVALGEDEQTVLGAGLSVRDAVRKAKKKSKKTPFLVHMPKEVTPYAGAV